MQRSGEYLLTLINDVLDLSKVEAGKLELYATAFNFSTFLQGITDLFHMRTQQKGISFRYEPLSSLPKNICADEKRLRQVLINLLGNAVKFTDQGKVVLKIGYQEEKIRFQVEDMGCGIASADIDKIFQPFQQVGEQQRRAEGTGLGLPITKKLVELMGGELQVKSTPGQGSTFWMALNLPAAPEVPTESAKQPLVKGFQGTPRTLLVIDDKWENRSVLTQLLTPLGFKVAEAGDGQTGVTIARQLKPDLILTDLVMPGQDGLETTRQLRAIPALAKVPIIAVSASVFDSFQQQSLAAGCNAFLPNPIRLEPLLELLQTQLGLTWIYESGPEGAAILETAVVSAAAGELVGPSPQEAAILLDLVMMGDIGGILEELEQLEPADEKLLPFVKRVRQLAKGFEEQKMGELVRQYVK
jgi:CheY-like chemotaxis protein/anti-sigma regulatory factor (Ser/Thr protein kinase)